MHLPAPAIAHVRQGLRRPLAVLTVICAVLGLVAAPARQARADAPVSGSISGTVVDAASGKPITDLCVYINSASGDSAGGSDQTDISGKYAVSGLPAGTYYVEYDDCSSSPVYPTTYWDGTTPGTTAYSSAEPISISAASPDHAANQSLEVGGSIAGTVTDAVTKSGVAGICVEADQGDNTVREAPTADDGSYTIAQLPAGSYSIEFTSCNGANYLNQWYPAGATQGDGNSIVVTSGQTTKHIDGALSAGGTITGTVTGQPGSGTATALKDICVSASGSAGYGFARTDANGQYTIRGLHTGSYTVEFEGCYDSASSWVQQWWRNAPDQQHANTVSVTAGQPTVGISATLVQGGLVSGSVVDASGTALRNICAAAYEEKDNSWWGQVGESTQTATDGTFTISGLPTGSYTIKFSYCGGDETDLVTGFYGGAHTASDASSVAVNAGTTAQLKPYTMSYGGSISGTVYGGAGDSTPLANMCVVASRSDGYDSVSDSTTADGTYSLHGLAPGPWTVHFSDCSDSPTYASQYFDGADQSTDAGAVDVVASQASAGVDAHLQHGASISGTVSVPSGRDASEVCVDASSGYDGGDYHDGYGAVAGDGTYSISGLDAQTYRVEFRDCSSVSEPGAGSEPLVTQYYKGADDITDAQPIPLRGGQSQSGVDATMVVGGSVTGTVTDAGGDPLNQICVRAVSVDDNATGYATSDSSGKYDVTGLPAGSYDLQFSDCGSAGYTNVYYDGSPDSASAVTVSVVAGQTHSGIDQTMTQGGEITGTLLAADGTPISGACVDAVNGQSFGTGRSGHDGSYTITGLASGTYRIYAQSCSDASTFVTTGYGVTNDNPSGTAVKVEQGQTKAGIDLRVPASGLIAGTVTSSGSAAQLCVQASGPLGTADTTVVNGSYQIPAPVGTVRVEVTDCANSSDLVSDVGSVTVSLSATTEHNVVLHPGGSIAGTVSGPTGPAVGVCVVADTPGDDWNEEAFTQTGSNGSYVLHGVPAGQSFVEFFSCSSGNFASRYYGSGNDDRSQATPVAVVVGQRTSAIDATLVAGGRVAGTLTDSSTGRPIAGSCVTLYSDGYQVASSTTDSRGDYEIDSLDAGSYDVEFSDCGVDSYETQWFDHASAESGAKPVMVTLGQTTSVGAALDPTTSGQSSGPTAAPTITSATAGSRQISVSWTAPSSGASAVTSYDVTATPVGSSTTATVVTASTDAEHLSTVISGLVNGVDYDVRVRADSAAGTGAWSAPASATPEPATTTTELNLPAATATVGSSVTLDAQVTAHGTPTGTVTFSDGSATPLAVAPVDSSGKASVTIDAPPQGTYQIAATYSGDDDFSGSTSSAGTLTVSQQSSTTSLASATNPTMFGEPTKLTATVGHSGSVDAGGSISFTTSGADPATLGTANVVAGTATLSLSTLPVGTTTIVARYSGDTTTAASSSTAVNEVVNQAQTTTAVEAPDDPADVGDDVSFTAHVEVVAPGAGSPSGSVQFMDGSSVLGSTKVDNSGDATFSTSTLPAGRHAITAEYEGDSSFVASTSSIVSQRIRYITSVVLTPVPTTSVFGQSVTLKAVVGTLSGEPTGTVDFMNGGTDLGSSPVLSDGTAQLITNALPVGIDSLSVGYDGDDLHATSISPAQDFSVTPALTSTTLTLDSAASTLGDVVTLTATVSVTAPGSGTPTGGVQFDDDGTSLGTGVLDSSGTAILRTAAIPAGAHSITASYAGSAEYNASGSGSTIHTVRYPTATVIAANPGTGVAGQQTTLTAVVSTDDQTKIPTGTVDFYDNTTKIGDAAIDSRGRADFATTNLQAGTHPLSAKYEGADLYSASQSSTSSYLVKPPAGMSNLAVTVDDSSGSPLAGASVDIALSNGKHVDAASGPDGIAHLTGLDDGPYTVAAYAPGYLPRTGAATVQNGLGSATIVLPKGNVAVASLTSSPMTPAQEKAVGIDPNDPANQNAVSFDLTLGFGPSGDGFRGYAGSGGFIGCPTLGTVPVSCSGGAAHYTIGSYNTTSTITYAHGEPELETLRVPVEATWLKEFFDVSMSVSNLAPSGFTLDNGTATLSLPSGLGLASTTASQALSQTVEDIPGGTSASVDWFVRGDAEGEYNLSADYDGTLEPFQADVSITAATDKALHVWGASALEFDVVADDHATQGVPFNLDVSVKNVADVPVYNLALNMPTEGASGFIYQPLQVTHLSTAQLDPGKSLSEHLILVPSADGFDASTFLSGAAVGLNGASTTFTSRATSGAAPQPKIVSGYHKLALSWKPVDGASEYQIFATGDRDVPFGSVPLATVNGSATPDADGYLRADVRGITPDVRSYYAITAIVGGVPEMIDQLEPASASSEAGQPYVSVSYDDASGEDWTCGKHTVNATFTFDSPDFGLSEYSFQAGDSKTITGSLRAVSEVTIPLTIPSSGPLEITMTAYDSDGDPGTPFTDTVGDDCLSPADWAKLLYEAQGIVANDQTRYPGFASALSGWLTQLEVVHTGEQAAGLQRIVKLAEAVQQQSNWSDTIAESTQTALSDGLSDIIDGLANTASDGDDPSPSLNDALGGFAEKKLGPYIYKIFQRSSAKVFLDHAVGEFASSNADAVVEKLVNNVVEKNPDAFSALANFIVNVQLRNALNSAETYSQTALLDRDEWNSGSNEVADTAKQISGYESAVLQHLGEVQLATLGGPYVTGWSLVAKTALDYGSWLLPPAHEVISAVGVAGDYAVGANFLVLGAYGLSALTVELPDEIRSIAERYNLDVLDFSTAPQQHVAAYRVNMAVRRVFALSQASASDPSPTQKCSAVAVIGPARMELVTNQGSIGFDDNGDSDLASGYAEEGDQHYLMTCGSVASSLVLTATGSGPVTVSYSDVTSGSDDKKSLSLTTGSVVSFAVSGDSLEENEDNGSGSDTGGAAGGASASDSPPVANDDQASTPTSTAVGIDVLANDTDPDGDTLTIASVGTPMHGVAAVSGQRVVYTPATGYTGTDSFVYTISDGRGGTAQATVYVTVAPADRPQLTFVPHRAVTAGRVTSVQVRLAGVSNENQVISLRVRGANTATATARTDASGVATFSYRERRAGIDLLTASWGNLVETYRLVVSRTSRSLVLDGASGHLRSLSVLASLAPDNGGTTVWIERRRRGRWVTLMRVRTNAAGQASGKRTGVRPGVYVLRAVVPTSALDREAQSQVITIRVRARR